MKTKSLLLAFGLAMMGCTPSPSESIVGAPKVGDTIQLPEIEWRIVNRGELERIYRIAGKRLEPNQKLYGFSARQGGKAIIYTLPPRKVDDDPTLILGHEVLHVALGEYHQ